MIEQTSRHARAWSQAYADNARIDAVQAEPIEHGEEVPGWLFYPVAALIVLALVKWIAG
jgi:hypothetical protein